MADVHDSHGIVVEDGGNVFGREFVGGVADEQASFPNGTVTDHNASVCGRRIRPFHYRWREPLT